MKDKVQKFGRFLSAMVMPNIGAFIAWGFITALFIETGWLPNATFATLVSPMLTYLLPILIAYTGGKMVHGTRGAVIGSIATFGVIVGSSITMFLGAMIMGPLAAWLLKKVDDLLEGKIPSGFEMLVNNFSLGILGMLLALVGQIGVGPLVEAGSNALGNGVKAIVNAGLLPLVSILVEPAKVLFLNNAINHGVLTPLGLEQAAEAGKSIFFLVEANPGPGLGVLLAAMIFGHGGVKESAPGAIIIHFLGGIHEIYFPYILMQPLLLLAVIGGGMAGVATLQLLNAGLVAAASPGSIIAVIAMTPKGGLLGVLAGVTVAAAVSFVIASFIYRFAGAKTTLAEGVAAAEAAKGSALKADLLPIADTIVFACDAGMGSSAMGASTLAKKLKNAGFDIKVIHTSIEEIPTDAKLVVTHESLAGRARAKVPAAEVVTIKNFVGAPEYDEIVNRYKKAK